MTDPIPDPLRELDIPPFEISLPLRGEIVPNSNSDAVPTNPNVSLVNAEFLKPWHQAHYMAATTWLQQYVPPLQASRLEQVRGYLEAFYHYSETKAWELARQILETQPDQGSCPLYEQLGIWGYYSEQIELCETLFGKLDDSANAICLQGMGKGYAEIRSLSEGVDTFKKLLTLAESLTHPELIFRALKELGEIQIRRGSWKEANVYFQRILNDVQDTQDTYFLIRKLSYLGWHERQINHFDTAEKYHQRALILSQDLNILPLTEKILVELGQLYSYWGKYDKAIPHIQKQFQISEQLGNLNNLCEALQSLATIYISLNQPDSAIDYLYHGLSISQEFGLIAHSSSTLNSLGIVYSHILHNYSQAVIYLEESLSFSEAIGYYFGSAYIQANLAYCHGCLRQESKALAYAQSALTFAEEHEARELKGIAIMMVANLRWHQRRWVPALLIAGQAMIIWRPWESANGHLMWRGFLRTVFGGSWARLKSMYAQLTQSGKQ